MERSNYFVERSDYYVERYDLEQSDHGTKLTDTVPEILKTSEDNLYIFFSNWIDCIYYAQEAYFRSTRPDISRFALG